MRRRQIVAVAVAVLLSFAERSAWGQVQYTVTDIGPGSVTINDGQFLYRNSSTAQSYSYNSGSWSYSPASAYGLVEAINSSGQAAGYMPGPGESFVYSPGNGATIIGPLYGSYASIPVGINNSGQVVGTFVNIGSASTDSAYLYNSSNHSLQPVGSLGGSNSSAQAINDSGQIVGWATTQGDATEDAFLYSNGTMHDLGVPGGGNTMATAINNSGQVVGTYTSNGNPIPFFYSNGTVTSLGITGIARSINNKGQVVGAIGISGNAGFLYSGGSLTSLQGLIGTTSGWTIKDASGINDNGLIVGKGINPSGQLALLR